MKVNRIIDSNVKSGDTKSGDTWSMSLVELNDGQLVRIFNPVEVGDTVYSEVNGKYTNWKVLKEARQAISNDVEKLINNMSAELQTLSTRVQELEDWKSRQEVNNYAPESRVFDGEDMPDSFLKISKNEEKK